MKLIVKIEPSHEPKSVEIDLSKHKISDAHWAEMSEEEKREAVENIIDKFDQPYWEVTRFKQCAP